MKADRPCPACGQGYLTRQVETNTVKMHGVEFDLPLHFSVCSSCESEVADSEECKENKRLMLEMKYKIEQDMGEHIYDKANKE